MKAAFYGDAVAWAFVGFTWLLYALGLFALALLLLQLVLLVAEKVLCAAQVVQTTHLMQRQGKAIFSPKITALRRWRPW